MPLMASPLSVLAQNIDSARQGIGELLNPDAVIITGQPGSGTRPTQGGGNIVVPGWDQVIRLGRPTTVPPEAWSEYYRAQRQGRQPNLDPDILAQIEKQIIARDAAIDSATPAWARSLGAVMNAVDNVQDFLSTVATAGRLLVWAAPKLGARLVPGIGWVILASDLLNLLNFVGMLAMPAYALLCNGPREALAAGVPAAVLKNALCKEVWTQAFRNPFSRAARLARLGRAAGRLPGISNLIEVAQTTDSLFGWGLSFGALYGMATDAIFASTSTVPYSNTSIDARMLGASVFAPYRSAAATMAPGARAATAKAAAVLASAPVTSGRQDNFTDEQHYEAMTALVAAVPIMAEFLAHGDADALLYELVGAKFAPPVIRSPRVWAALMDGSGRHPGADRWWFDDAPAFARGGELIDHLAPAIQRATVDFLKPRRNVPQSAYYGAAVCNVTDWLWMMHARDDRLFHWELTTDYKLLTALAVDGRFPRSTENLDQLWDFWSAARARSEQRDGELLYDADWTQLAAQAGIDLLRILPPDAPVPPEWGRPREPSEQATSFEQTTT